MVAVLFQYSAQGGILRLMERRGWQRHAVVACRVGQPLPASAGGVARGQCLGRLERSSPPGVGNLAHGHAYNPPSPDRC